MIYMIPVCSVVCLQSVSSMPWMVGSWITKSSCRLITWALTRTQLDSDALQTTCCHLRLRSPTAAAGSILAPAPHNSSSSSSSCCCCWSELSYVTRLPMPDAYSSRQPPSSSSMRNTDRNTYQDKPFPPPTSSGPLLVDLTAKLGCHKVATDASNNGSNIQDHICCGPSNSLCVLRAFYWRRNKNNIQDHICWQIYK